MNEFKGVDWNDGEVSGQPTQQYIQPTQSFGASQPVAKPKSSKKGILLIVIILIAIVAIVAVFAFNRLKKNENKDAGDVTVAEALDEAKEWMGETKDKVLNTSFNDIKDGAKNIANDTSEAVSNAVDKASGVAVEEAEKAKEKNIVGKATDSVKNFFSGLFKDEE